MIVKIISLFKKGDVNNPNNYRGISLCDVTSKIYSSIINTRLQKWIEENNCTGEHQAGFKKNYSTVDHVFTLLAAVQKQLVNNKKMYVAFIDFEKAFDTISRKLLWPVLIKNGVKGKLFNCIKSMYDNVKAKVRSGTSFTDYIMCTSGVKQGDALSPVLFSLFINELASEVIQQGKHGAIFSPEFIELFILLFADDIILLAETVVGLQNRLNILYRTAMELGMKVNMSKSQIVVFRNGGYLSSKERWFYGSECMSVVNTYKYLGVFFSTKLSFSYTCSDLISKGKKAVLGILKTLNTLKCNSVHVFFKMFDTQVQSIVQYGSEIWGLDKAAQDIEKVHTFAMKKFLCVDLRTPNVMIYSELGRYPIYLNSYVRSVSYWLKLTRMAHTRLPYKAYKMLYCLDEKGKKTWVTNIRILLCRYGFSYVWNNQGVGFPKSFLRTFRQRLIDCKLQDFDDYIQSNERFSFYRLFNKGNYIQPYLLMDLDRFLRLKLTKLRLGVSPLATHYFRYRTHVLTDLICPLCKESEEDEVHFVLQCPFFADIREQLIPAKYTNNPCSFRLCLLLATTNVNTARNLALFLYKAFKRRGTVLE